MKLLIYALLIMVAGIFSGTLIGASVGLASLLAHGSLGLERTIMMCNMLGWDFARSFTLTAIPLFILMGEIFARSGLIDDLFGSFLLLTRGKIPGGLLQPCMLTATIFSAFSGSSTASTACLGKVIHPVLRKNNYDDALSTGALAAGGSLDMMIPPSIILVVFASITDTSLGRLYIAAFIPGLMSAALFMIYLGIKIPRPWTLVADFDEGNRFGGPKGKEIRRAGLSLVPFLGMIIIVMGPLYLGVATATEIAAIGTAGSILLCVMYKKFNFKLVWDSAMDAVRVTCFIYFIMFGTLTFGAALASSGVTIELPELMKSVGNQHIVFALITLFYLILGMLFDPMSILLLTSPFMFPVITAFGFSGFWCGIYIALQIQIGLLTPPVGINLFVMHGTTGVPFATISRGALPFVVILLFVTVLIYLFPQLVDWLPNMIGSM